MAKILFVHNGAPGRFAFLARLLLARGDELMLLNPPDGTDLAGVPTVRWQPERGSAEGIYPPATKAEADIIRGVAAAAAATRTIREGGFTPDLIVGHPGWGEMAFLHDAFPDARQIQIGEYYYRARGGDVGFDPEFAATDFRSDLVVTGKNAVLAMSLAEADRIVCPTPFQANLFPAAFRDKAVVIHEGIDTETTRPREGVRIQLGDGRVLDGTAPVVTFVNRAFEPMRGVHVFLRALPRLLAARPDVQVLMIGADIPPVYGARPAGGGTWKAAMLAELGDRLDLSRVHFTGPLSYEQLLAAFSISAAHVYLTYPFVLSWSLLDAMACECLLVASDTAPVRDVISHGRDGLLVDFFDVEGLADTLAKVCTAPEDYSPLRRAARAKVVAEYDRRTVTEPAWLALIDDLLSRRRGA
jgi:glycosyltransferase involved in cell wall biosynthesis